MKERIISLKKTARLAGLLYLILGITGFYGIMYVPMQIIVSGNIADTSGNIIANEFLFRTGVASHLISVISFLFLALVLYKLFKQVNSQQARLLLTLVIVQVPIIFILEICRLTSLEVLKGEVLKSLTPGQLQDLSWMFIKIHSYGIMIVEIFWGLWLFPFGLLIYKSGFIPRALGVLLILAGIGYTADSLTFILFPQYREFTKIAAFTFSGLGELSTILWLLIVGAKDHLAITIISETEMKRKPTAEKLKEPVT